MVGGKRAGFELAVRADAARAPFDDQRRCHLIVLIFAAEQLQEAKTEINVMRSDDGFWRSDQPVWPSVYRLPHKEARELAMRRSHTGRVIDGENAS